MLTRLSFARKISLHIVSLILASTVLVTLISVYHLRKQVYAYEFRNAFTAYMAANNYLNAHYRGHRDSFNRRSLNYVLSEKFLVDQSMGVHYDTLRPRELTIYNEQGELVYEFSRRDTYVAPARIAVELLPATYRQSYDRKTSTITVSGPIDPEHKEVGFVHISFETNIGNAMGMLYAKIFSVSAVVLLVAMAISMVFARRELEPVMVLTRVADKIHAGDLTQRVPVTSNDEVGMLATTFNSMIASVVRRMELMNLTQEWTLRLGKEFDLRKLYDVLMDMFERMSLAKVCRLYIYDPRSDSLDLAAFRGTGTTISLRGDQLTRMAFELSAGQYLKPDKKIEEEPHHALEIALPLLTAGKRVGVVRLGAREDGLAYDEESLTTLQTLVQLAAVSIDNTRLYKDLAEKERFAQEMKWAREIQHSLQPRELPVLPGYEIFGASIPALEVGGDYFDYVHSPGGNWHFVVGDVSGKGVPAALIMSIVRSLIHTFVEMTPSPLEVLTRVNRNLTPDLESEMFVTMAEVSLDPVQHTARVVRAGHEPIIVLKRNGEIQRLEPRGTAIGLLDVAIFERSLEERIVPLDQGDTMILYTDGVTETRSRAGAEFSYEGIENILRRNPRLPVQDMVNLLVEEVRSFGEGQEQQDDITIVVIRRQDAP